MEHDKVSTSILHIQDTAKYKDEDYKTALQQMRSRFAGVAGPLFHVSTAVDLWATYISSFDEPFRQWHNCHSCKQFIRRYGNLVSVQPNGELVSAMWQENDIPGEYKQVFARLRLLVESGKITGVFADSRSVLGTMPAGGWEHFTVDQSIYYDFGLPWLKPSSMKARKKEDYELVRLAIRKYSIHVLTSASTLLQHDSFHRSEVSLPMVNWLLDLRQNCKTHPTKMSNLIWLASATAPSGFCHISNTVTGTLLDDLHAGVPITTVVQKFNSKTDGLKYMRPVKQPSEGNINVAERRIKELNLAQSLRRRYALLEDCQSLWTPTELSPIELNTELFAHLRKRKGQADSVMDLQDLGRQRISWSKFSQQVLPEALQIECKVPYGIAPFITLVTAADASALPILKWDHHYQRNPVSWYVYHQGAPASYYNLVSGDYAKVNMITTKPCHWFNQEMPSFVPGLIFILDNANDRGRLRGLALFPEILKSSLFDIRQTIEAYSNGRLLEGEKATACGLLLSEQVTGYLTLRVTTKTAVSIYELDRIE